MRSHQVVKSPTERPEGFRKDESLNRLAEVTNVAQFVSFSPGASSKQEFSRVRGYVPNFVFEKPKTAIAELLARCPENSVNVRSFTPENPRSNDFLYGLSNVDEAAAALDRFKEAGLYTIVNETVDVQDGGVSGVFEGGTIEFAPDDTPRCVEKPGVASLPQQLGQKVLEAVYGFKVEPGFGSDVRLEFSIHPRRRGWRNTHFLGWELEFVGSKLIQPSIEWPNRFSRHIGDKVFGLLLASELGLPVPQTTVIGRRVAPFIFGQDTGTSEIWIRTSPMEQVPGRFTTEHGWRDPFALMQREDPSGNRIASVLAQKAVLSAFSGALIVGADGRPIVEGRAGEGEDLMRGTALPEQLPSQIMSDVIELFDATARLLGPVRIEWVHDGNKAWLVQLHRGATLTSRNTLVPGEPSRWHRFDVSHGLEALRRYIGTIPREDGLVLVGQVGLTSHVADVVRKAGVPTKLESA
jgi:hypothetical protein